MTRDEIIKEYKAAVAAHAAASAAVIKGAAKSFELFKDGLSALRPVSREQVEKMFRGCEVCKGAKYVTGSVSAVAPHDDQHEIETDAEGDFDFCPVCGRPITDEAVDIVMRRLEALKDGRV